MISIRRKKLYTGMSPVMGTSHISSDTACHHQNNFLLLFLLQLVPHEEADQVTVTLHAIIAYSYFTTYFTLSLNIWLSNSLSFQQRAVF